MVSTIHTPLKPMLRYRLYEKLTKTYWYHYNENVPFWMPLKCQCFVQYIICKFGSVLSACLPACHKTSSPGCASATAPAFLYNKGNHIGFTKCCSNKCLSTVPWCFLLFFYYLVFKLFTGKWEICELVVISWH